MAYTKVGYQISKVTHCNTVIFGGAKHAKCVKNSSIIKLLEDEIEIKRRDSVPSGGKYMQGVT